jgi:hypothetical protein
MDVQNTYTNLYITNLALSAINSKKVWEEISIPFFIFKWLQLNKNKNK